MADSPLAGKINTLIEFLKQPSTIKALGTLAGAVGYYIDPSKVVEILMALQVFFGAINLFYDANPRKSVDAEPAIVASVADLDKVLTTAQLAELVRLRKAKIASDKESAIK
jgi:hypothetical protein